MKELMFKRLSQISSLNKPYEGHVRQTYNDENFKKFIAACGSELRKEGKCLCFTLEQVNELRSTYCITVDCNKYHEFTCYIYQGPSFLIKTNTGERWYPMDTPLDKIPKGDILRYEYISKGDILRYEYISN